MARKSTKKSKEEAEVESKTEKKTKSKTTKTTKTTKTKTQNDNIKLTFRPIFSAATNFTAYLQEKAVRVHNGSEMIVDVPIVEGLPGTLTVKAGEIITVTQAQLDKLTELGFIESDEQVADRKAIEKGLAPQHPERLSYDIMASNRDFNIKPRELEKIYTDKLIIVD